MSETFDTNCRECGDPVDALVGVIRDVDGEYMRYCESHGKPTKATCKDCAAVESGCCVNYRILEGELKSE